MNFRKHAEPTILGFMIAPMVDILLVVLVFFIVTWNFALSENELDVRVRFPEIVVFAGTVPGTVIRINDGEPIAKLGKNIGNDGLTGSDLK